MKISELLNEEEKQGTIKAISGDDVTIDMGGQEIKTKKDSLLPGADPNTAIMKPTDTNELKPGMKISSETETTESQDEYGGDPTDDFINDVVDHDFEDRKSTRLNSSH